MKTYFIGGALLVALVSFGIFLTSDDEREISSVDGDTTYQAPSKLSNVKEKNADSLGTIYKIWVRSYHDSNADGHGDIAGVTKKLQSLQELGIKSILLSPIFSSPAYHGYEVSNFTAIQTEYGSIEDFNNLIAQAKLLNIKIFLDLPINHTSDQHPWFVESTANKSLYNDYYIWTNALKEGYGLPWLDTPSPLSVFHTSSQREDEYYYGVFGYASPDLNYKNQAVVSEMKDVMAFWLDKGVDGFRLDAARYLVEEGPIAGQRDTQSNFALLEELKQFALTINPDVLFIGEVFANDEVLDTYLKRPDGLDYYFNFQFGFSLRSLVEDNNAPINEKVEELQSIYADMPFSAKYFSNQIALLNNHDLKRVKLDSFSDYKLLYSMFLTSPFALSLYYGEEVSLSSYDSNNDIFYRDLMSFDCNEPQISIRKSSWIVKNLDTITLANYNQWLSNRETSSVIKECNELTSHISNLLKLREQNSAFFLNTANIETDLSDGEFFILTYSGVKQTVFIIINMDTTNSRTFWLNKLPYLNFRDLHSTTIYDGLGSIDIDAADVLILLGK